MKLDKILIQKCTDSQRGTVLKSKFIFKNFSKFHKIFYFCGSQRKASYDTLYGSLSCIEGILNILYFCTLPCRAKPKEDLYSTLPDVYLSDTFLYISSFFHSENINPNNFRPTATTTTMPTPFFSFRRS